MVNKTSRILFVLLLCLLNLPVCSHSLLEFGGDESFDPAANVDERINPGDDFYKYACGKWIESHPVSSDGKAIRLPYADLEWNRRVFESGLDPAFVKLSSLLKGYSPKTEGAMALSVLKEIDAADSIDEAISTIIDLGKRGFPMLFAINEHVASYDGHLVPSIEYDFDIVNYILEIKESKDEEFMQNAKAAFRDYFEYTTYGTADDFDTILSEVLDFIYVLFPQYKTGSDNNRKNGNVMRRQLGFSRLPEYNHSSYILSVLEKSPDMMPDCLVYRILKSHGYDDKIISESPLDDDVKNLVDKIGTLTNADLHSLKALMKFFILHFFVFSDGTLFDVNDYNKIVNDMNLMYNASRLYANKYGKPMKDEITEMLEGMRDVFRQRLEDNSWLDADTKSKAMKKLGKMKFFVSSPSAWNDSYMIKPNAGWTSIVRARLDTAIQHERHAYEMIENYGSDDNAVFFFAYDMLVSASELNSFAIPELNLVLILPRAYNSYWYSSERDMAYNYGMIGLILAHEITHNFDSPGSAYDEDGRLSDWWTAQSKENFRKLCNDMIEYYGEFAIDSEGHKVDGEKSLGENIADLGGLVIAYDSMLKHYGGKSDSEFLADKRRKFLLGVGNVFCCNIPEEFLYLMTFFDVHTPSCCRSNAILANFNPWYETFGIGSDARLYRAPQDRIKIW